MLWSADLLEGTSGGFGTAERIGSYLGILSTLVLCWFPPEVLAFSLIGSKAKSGNLDIRSRIRRCASSVGLGRLGGEGREDCVRC